MCFDPGKSALNDQFRTDHSGFHWTDDQAIDLVEQLVLRCFDLPVPSLRRRDRGKADIAFARQVAIYLLHTHLGLSLTAAGRVFGRDRTTAAHACERVEDRRDSRRVDRTIVTIEAALHRWQRFGRPVLADAAQPSEIPQ